MHPSSYFLLLAACFLRMFSQEGDEMPIEKIGTEPLTPPPPCLNIIVSPLCIYMYVCTSPPFPVI